MISTKRVAGLLFACFASLGELQIVTPVQSGTHNARQNDDASSTSFSSSPSFSSSFSHRHPNTRILVASFDSATTSIDTPVRIPVLANDGYDYPSSIFGGNPPRDFEVCFHSHSSSSPSSSSPPSSSSSTSSPLRSGQVRFTDVTSSAGVKGKPQKTVKTSPNCIFPQYDFKRDIWDPNTFCMPEILTGGASTADADGDGLDDLYVTRMESADSLYRNNGDGTFTDITVQAGLGITSEIRSNSVAFFDIENDGDIDIYISTMGDRRMYLFVNDGTGFFTEEAVERGVDLTRPAVGSGEGGLTSSFSIAIGDYNGDGFLDIYTTEWFPRLDMPEYLWQPEEAIQRATCRLFKNRGGESNEEEKGGGGKGKLESTSRAGYFADDTWNAGIRLKIGGTGPNSKKMSQMDWFTESNQDRIRNILLAQMGVTEEAELEERMEQLNEQADAMFRDQYERSQMINHVMSSLEEDNNGVNPYRFPAIYMQYPYVGVFQFGARFVDLNNDGWPELIISGDFGTTQLYWNNRNGTFTPGPLHILWDSYDNSMGASIGDVNADGKLDVLFTSMALKTPTRLAVDRFFPGAGIASNFEGNHLYLNEGNGLFADVTPHAGVKDTGWAWGGVLFDYDNDGWLDIAICNGIDDPETTDDDFAVNTPNAAFHNGGPRNNFSFTPVGGELGLDDKRDGRGYFEFDYDNDGDLDLFLANHADYPVLYRNDGGNTNNFLRVHVRDSECLPSSATAAAQQQLAEQRQPLTFVTTGCTPRYSVGAKVYLQAAPGAREFLREVGSAAAFMAQSELVAHFGVGGRKTIHRVRIFWPLVNATRLVYNVPARTTLTVLAPDQENVVIESYYGEEQKVDAASGGTSTTTEVDGKLISPLQACSSLKLRVLSVDKQQSSSSSSISVASESTIIKTENGGTASISSNRLYVTYVPKEGFIGTDTFTYTLANGDEETASNTVTVTVSEKSGRSHGGNAHASAASASSASNSNNNNNQRGTESAAAIGPRGGGSSVFPRDDTTEETIALGTVLPSFTGRFNNLANPEYGAAGTPLIRLAVPRYAPTLNGFDMPGNDGVNILPSARLVSNKLFTTTSASSAISAAAATASSSTAAVRNFIQNGAGLSDLFTWFSAFVMHDLSESTLLHFIRRPSGIGNERDNIHIPPGDPMWDPSSSSSSSSEGEKGDGDDEKSSSGDDTGDSSASSSVEGLRMPFRRAVSIFTTSTSGATTNGTRARQQLNFVTHYADLHTLYGVSSSRHDSLRNFKTILLGSMKLSYPSTSRGGKGDSSGKKKTLTVPEKRPNVGNKKEGSSSSAAAAGNQYDADIATAVFTENSGRPQALLPVVDEKDDKVSLANVYNRPLKTLFFAGDDRSNLFPGLTILHTLFVREHNRICAALASDEVAKQNIMLAFNELEQATVKSILAKNQDPSLADRVRVPIHERIFWSAASLVKARYQAILWYEYLPALVGLEEFAKIPTYKGYNASMDPSVSNEFATAAGVFWHSGLGSEMHRFVPFTNTSRSNNGGGDDDEMNSAPTSVSYVPAREGPMLLRDAYFLHNRRYAAPSSSSSSSSSSSLIDSLLRGAWSTAAQEIDLAYVDDIRESFVGAQGLGLDLAAIDIQRGRDHGLPSYTQMRCALGLAAVTSFEQMTAHIQSKPLATRLAARLAELYNGRIDDVDLLVGALLEPHISSGNGAVGETFGKIFIEQFVRTRDGDRFWFENTQSPMSGVLTAMRSVDTHQNVKLKDIIGANSGLSDILAEVGERSDEEGGVKGGSSMGVGSKSMFYVKKNLHHTLEGRGR